MKDISSEVTSVPKGKYMKTKLFLPLILVTLLVGYVAHAVSVEWVRLQAVEMGDLEFSTDEDNNVVGASVEFSGSELKTLMALLPETRSLEEEGEPVLEYWRAIEVLGDEDSGKVSSISLHCETKEYNEKQELVDVKNEVKCRLYIHKGLRAG